MPSDIAKKFTSIDVSYRSAVLDHIELLDDQVISCKLKDSFDDNNIVAVRHACAPYQNTIILLVIYRDDNNDGINLLSNSRMHRYRVVGDDLYLDVYDFVGRRITTWCNGEFMGDGHWDITEIEWEGPDDADDNVNDA